jgi:hypothetical protein
VSITPRQLAASLRACIHIADREAIARFLFDPATETSLNPFRQTSAGAQRSIWAGQSFEFRSSRTEALGLTCLLRALDTLPAGEPLVQELFGAGPYRASIYHLGDGCQLIGAVLHGRGPMALPVFNTSTPRRIARRSPPTLSRQLDLFAFAGLG